MRAALAKVSPERLARRIAELGGVGKAPSGGVTRLGLSREEEAARELVAGWLRARGARVRRDEAANLLARIGGDGAPIVVASHLDSVPDGGRFDGALGVLCAIELVDALADAGVAHPPLEVVAWTDEEGARFGVGLFGSAAAYGRLPAGITSRADGAGVTIAEALHELGFRGEPNRARRPADRAYFEIHIEQGPTLEQRALPLGVVSSIVGITHARVTVEGAQGHAGTTPMEGRADALVAAAELVVALEAAARHHPPSVATVGEIAALPGAKNVVPGRCTFSIDVRAPEDVVRHEVVETFEARLRWVEAERRVRTSVDVLSDVPAVPLDGRLRDALRQACREVGVEAPELVSGAGHDAQNAALVGVPSAMLFVRSRNGSHNPAEDASAEDAALAVQALLLAIERVA